ncbi:hypothetical protein [Brevibacillus laterosporus]|uniref:hypothetical protein n=1 Tax=Brevibacillus laterosporus TaxID=1465 RepID=UPI000E6CDE51|nr:hypothetical protein [Brevibacillus laterosporus]AYB37551.1 hypothetical protein D5F52_04235 [Brevibacillus laterosporus]MBM7111338.1 hypothetical protein [Brevibacillus laterosporus]
MWDSFWKSFNVGRKYHRGTKNFWRGYFFEQKADSFFWAIMAELFIALCGIVHYAWSTIFINTLVILSLVFLVYFGVKLYISKYHIAFCITFSVIITSFWAVILYMNPPEQGTSLIFVAVVSIISLYFHLVGLIRV